ncbi:beta-1,4-N-acetylgalactosaminyltransferase bre-4-like [Littorina saxatilis]|uniref:Beta-1,4-N-acetylgalactosaminyltransferase bre-4 n=1 Tax=Littorina saxatilis TaxID=31220 RepID=A0AAN9GGV2_9CAEN
MLPPWRKFRMFVFLLLFGALVNVVFFRSFFNKGFHSLQIGALSRYSSKTNPSGSTLFITRDLNATLNASAPVVVKHDVEDITKSSSNITKEGSPVSKGNGDVTKGNGDVPKSKDIVSKSDPTKESAGVNKQSGDVSTGVGGEVTKNDSSNVLKNIPDVRKSVSDVIKGQGDVTKGRSNDTKSSVNVTQGDGAKLQPVDGRPKPLEAFGKLVVPRANVTAPWKRNTTTTPCPLVPPNLVGPLATYENAPNFTEIVRLNPGLEPGGHYHPPDCRARHRVAVIVPYRDRELHLRRLLHNLHPILMRQQLDYFVLVVELELPMQFNRGLLLNIGAVEALGLWDVQCFILHDVDLVPENDKNLYTCPEMPRHMSAAVDKFSYRLPYTGIFGGVTALKREHFYKINGYSNVYFGWGGEDDDLAGRVRGGGLKVTRYSMDVARYKMIKHSRDKKNEPNPKRFQMLNQWKKRQAVDGLNSLEYQVKKVEFREGYTWMLVTVDQEKMLKPLGKS